MCPSSPAFAILLGPTNPQMIIMAAEPLAFRCAGFSPALWLLVPAFSLLYAPLWVTPSASMHRERSPTDYDIMKISQSPSFGDVFEPRSFSAHNLLTSELLRFL